MKLQLLIVSAKMALNSTRPLAISPSDIARYTHTDLSCITAELWELQVLFTIMC